MIGIVFRRNFASIPNHIKEFVENRSNIQCYDRIFNSKWKILDAPENKGTCLVEIKVDETLANVNKVIHGGALASLVDLVTTMALFNTPIRKPGISVSINISYIKPAKLNESILVEGKVVKAGSKLAYLAADIYLKDKDSIELKKELLVATATHNKYIL